MPSKRLLLLAGLFFFLLPGCIFTKYQQAVLLKPQSSPKAPIRDHYVIFINMDGSRPEDAQRWAAAGILPNIQKLFFEEGAVFENAITVVPTLSIPAHQAFISGLFPGHHGTPNLDWYSRAHQEYMDYLTLGKYTSTNIWVFNFLQLLDGKVLTDEPNVIFADLKGYPTLAVMEPINFAAGKYIPKILPTKSGIAFSMGKEFERVDFLLGRMALKTLRKVPTGQFPRFTMITFPGLDATSHNQLPDSKEAQTHYRYYDRFIGILVKHLKKRGIWDKTTLVLVSDHGQHLLKGNVNLPKIIHQIGFLRNGSRNGDRRVVWSQHSNGNSQLYFRVGPDWKKRPSYRQLRHFSMDNGNKIDLVQAFLKHPRIEYVILPENPWTTHIFNKKSHAKILRKRPNGKFLYAYVSEQEEDPLGYFKVPKIRRWAQQGKYLDAEAWLAETAGLELPDVVVGLPQFFDDYRGGDMLLMTYKEYQFSRYKPSAHGSLDRGDRRVNLMFHGPDIRPGRYPHARVVDTYPTMLALFGLKTTAPIDGIPRFEIFKESFPVQSLIPWGPNGKALAPQAFKGYLEKKLKTDDLNEDEELKAKQLIYDIEQFFSRWKNSSPSNPHKN